MRISICIRAHARTKGVILIVSRENIAQKHSAEKKNHRVYQRTPVVAADMFEFKYTKFVQDAPEFTVRPF